MKNQCKWYPVCPMKYYYEAGEINKNWIKEYCHGNWEICVRYQKEEAGIYHSDKMLPDGNIDNNLS